MMVLLPGLLSTDRFASERSAVTLARWRSWGGQGQHSPPLNFKPRASPGPALATLRTPGCCIWKEARTSPGSHASPGQSSLPAIKPMFEEVEECLLHHVCDLGWGAGEGERNWLGAFLEMGSLPGNATSSALHTQTLMDGQWEHPPTVSVASLVEATWGQGPLTS